MPSFAATNRACAIQAPVSIPSSCDAVVGGTALLRGQETTEAFPVGAIESSELHGPDREELLGAGGYPDAGEQHRELEIQLRRLRHEIGRASWREGA